MRNLSHLLDAEILVELAEARFHSPVINELCLRLESKRATVSFYELDCPVCRATLNANLDATTEELTMETRK